MNAIKACRLNFSYIQANIAPNETWFHDLVKAYLINCQNGEETYVYTMVRGTGDRQRTYYYWTTGTKFNERFTFESSESFWMLFPITAK